jgi:LysM repeat protein
MNFSSSLQAIYNNPGSITIVSPTLYSIDSTTGQFITGNSSFDEPIEASIINHGLQVWPLIGSGSDSAISNMLGCAEYQTQFIQAAMSVATFSLNGTSYSINGYNIDFEPSPGITSGSHYTVQAGDSLIAIGQKCGVSWQFIASANNIAPPYAIQIGQSLVIPSRTPIYEEFDQFMSSFANVLHQKGMTLSVDVATWNMISSEAPNNGGVFWDYAGLANSVDYVAEMDYVSTFCYTSQNISTLAYSPSCKVYTQLNPKGWEGSTFYDQYQLTSEFVPQSKIMIGLESISCGQDFGGGSNCLAGQEISFLVNSGVPAIGIWPTPVFLSTYGWNPYPYSRNDDWYALSKAFVLGNNSQASPPKSTYSPEPQTKSTPFPVSISQSTHSAAIPLYDVMIIGLIAGVGGTYSVIAIMIGKVRPYTFKQERELLLSAIKRAGKSALRLIS